MDFMMRLLEPQLRVILPAIVFLLATAFACALTWLVTTWAVNARWRARRDQVAPELCQELEEERLRAEAAERRLQEAEQERDALAAAVRGARSILALPRLEVREQLRGRGR